jgi:hypothetical protein
MPETTEKKTVGELLADDKKIERAMQIATRKAILEHKRAGFPVVVVKEGKIVWLQPDEIPDDLLKDLED